MVLDAVLRDLDIQFATPYSRIVDLSRGMAWPEWCPGGEMNIVHNLLDRYVRRWTNGREDCASLGGRSVGRAAPLDDVRGAPSRRLPRRGLLAVSRTRPRRRRRRVHAVHAGMRDRHAGHHQDRRHLPSPLFGVRIAGGGGAAGRRKRGRVVTEEGFTRRGRWIALRSTAEEAAALVTSVRHVLVPDWSAHPPDSPTARTGADSPMMLIYTSGTSGVPRAGPHTLWVSDQGRAGMMHGLDSHSDETLCWITDMGWMMGPWLVFGTLLCGATMMLYDGALDWPGPDRLWEVVERHRITALGISPTLVRVLMRHGDATAARTSVLLAKVRIDRRTVESGCVALAFRRGW